MALITSEEIQKLYKKCGVTEENEGMRTKINTGTLGNKLNTCKLSAHNNSTVMKINL
ncbi:hypothetical protein MCG98_18580 [Ruminococcus sp. OA3]|uniref:hypothetical protein n=1 Tax=Ruminococcus sp. OA3 TaxID=2914164 RepID=UPI001F059A2D|nr:hypothetical protein [Ruminococcus sp. OA3]MCH1984564.1 hypothetical protein [Ruminococcus sp. OA3]